MAILAQNKNTTIRSTPEMTENAIFGSTPSRKSTVITTVNMQPDIIIGLCSVMDGACRMVIIGRRKRKKHFTRKSPFNTRACLLGLVFLRSRMPRMRIVIRWVEMAAGEGFLNSQLSPKPHGMNCILRWPGCGKFGRSCQTHNNNHGQDTRLLDHMI